LVTSYGEKENSMQRSSLALVVGVLALAAVQARAASLATVDFESGIPAGWVFVNNSDTVGANWDTATSKGHVNTAVSGTHFAWAGDTSVANVGSNPGQCNNWLILPEMQFNVGDVVTFSTNAGSSHNADSLEVRFSANGASQNAGVGISSLAVIQPYTNANTGTPSPGFDFATFRTAVAGDVGDFTINPLTINPTSNFLTSDYPGFSGQSYDVYPTTWTPESVTITSAFDGRLAFRYLCYDGGFNGANSTVAAIDDVAIAPAPEPASLALLGLSAGLLLVRRTRRGA